MTRAVLRWVAPVLNEASKDWKERVAHKPSERPEVGNPKWESGIERWSSEKGPSANV